MSLRTNRDRKRRRAAMAAALSTLTNEQLIARWKNPARVKSGRRRGAVTAHDMKVMDAITDVARERGLYLGE